MCSHVLFEAYRRELARKAAELHRREKVEKEKVVFERLLKDLVRTFLPFSSFFFVLYFDKEQKA